MAYDRTDFPRLPALERADIKFSAAAARAGQRNPAVAAAAKLSILGDQRLLGGGALTMFAIGRARHDKRLSNTGLRMLAAFVLADAAASLGKTFIWRTRPSRFIDTGEYSRALATGGRRAAQSFPSRHAACAVAVARAYGRAYPKAARPAVLSALAVAAQKVVKGDHFVSDILAGAALGVLAEFVAGALVGRGASTISSAG